MSRRSVGLDIGSRAVSVAEVTSKGSRPTLTRLGRALLEEGAVQQGEIRDAGAVARVVAMLWRKLGLRGRSVHVAIANRRVVVRTIELPAMSRSDLASAIRFRAQDHIPIPLEQAVMDFEVLDEVERDDGRFLQLLVVAVERSTIEPLLLTLEAAGLEPASLELTAHPLVRCFGGSSDTQAIVDVGGGVTNVVVEREKRIVFTRILSGFGGEDFTNAIAEALGVERGEAERLKRRALPACLVAPASRPVPASARRVVAARSATALATAPGSDPSLPEQAAEAVGAVIDRFVTEVRGSLDFYAAQPGAHPVARIVITGGGSLTGGLAERLGAALGVNVVRGRPFERVSLGKVRATPDELLVAEPFVGVAVGLALARGGK